MSEVKCMSEQEHYADTDDDAVIYKTEKCPECRKPVDPANSVKDSALDDYYFCSEECKNEYLPF